MPPIIKKILNIARLVIMWACIIYLVLTVIILPFALTWAIRTQGVKFTNHQVHVRSVWFNPFLWRLNVKGLEVFDSDNKTVMVGFDKFTVDVSFLKLFKKIYRLETVSLDGLKVRTVLLPDGKVNLLSLIPTSAAPAQTAAPESKAPEPAQPVTPENKTPETDKPLPMVVVDQISLTNGRIQFVDQSVSPSFSTELGGININVTGFSTEPEGQTKIVFQAMLDGKGQLSSEVLIKPLVQPLQLETIFSMDNYVMSILTPYVGKYTGKELSNGKMDFKMNYRIADNKLTATHKLLIQHFEFGKKVDSKDALGLPFGLAVALLEDPQGKISISLPVKGDMNDPEFEYWHLVGQVARNFFLKLITKPFAILASVVGGGEEGTDEMGYVRFVPGKAELSKEDQEKLNKIIAGLQQRPKLSLEINGSYDPDVDWKAIKTDVFVKDFNDLKAESSKIESWVYRTLYQRRFGVRALFKLINQYQHKKEDIADNPQLNAEIKRQLIEDAPPDKLALDVLAQTRSKMIYDLVIASGFDAKRLSIGPNRSTQSSMGLVPVEFTLTVYGDTPAADPAASADPAAETAVAPAVDPVVAPSVEPAAAPSVEPAAQEAGAEAK